METAFKTDTIGLDIYLNTKIDHLLVIAKEQHKQKNQDVVFRS